MADRSPCGPQDSGPLLPCRGEGDHGHPGRSLCLHGSFHVQEETTSRSVRSPRSPRGRFSQTSLDSEPFTGTEKTGVRWVGVDCPLLSFLLGWQYKTVRDHVPTLSITVAQVPFSWRGPWGHSRVALCLWWPDRWPPPVRIRRDPTWLRRQTRTCPMIYSDCDLPWQLLTSVSCPLPGLVQRVLPARKWDVWIVYKSFIKTKKKNSTETNRSLLLTKNGSFS